jgi:hypothetical protein
MRPVLVIALLLWFPTLSEAQEHERDSSMESNMAMVIDFSSPEMTGRWMIVNDGVMGGLSSSQIEVTDDGHGVFSGTVSLENNGGFASTRVMLGDVEMAGYNGIALRVKGDGKQYQFRIRTDELFDGAAYRQTFETVSDEWIDITLPFSDFVASFRGRELEGAPPVDPEQIRQIGFLIADKQAGEFRLEIESIAAYK